MHGIRYAGLSDVGRQRATNEDRWCADPKQGLFLVADGIGGSAAGGLASQIVAEVLPGLLRSTLRGLENGAAEETTKRVAASLVDLSEHLRSESQIALGVKGVGSTVVLALVRSEQAVVAHLGDSRAYRWRAGHLEQLTTDHTIVQLLLERGEISPQEAATHPSRGQLTRFVGMAAEALPEIERVELTTGDRLLLCSDGLSGMLSDEQIRGILDREPVPENACRQLVQAANQAGGTDNITALVVAVGDSGSDAEDSQHFYDDTSKRAATSQAVGAQHANSTKAGDLQKTREVLKSDSARPGPLDEPSDGSR
ncbi:MAG TPA: protein phosphatase 2C domain-containing protein [Pirellulales bacterium]|jgi:protein phosphatase|nr:protein phosphatase 2C domain-containing protein [Pirellulales bacterium]